MCLPVSEFYIDATIQHLLFCLISFISILCRESHLLFCMCHWFVSSHRYIILYSVTIPQFKYHSTICGHLDASQFLSTTHNNALTLNFNMTWLTQSTTDHSHWGRLCRPRHYVQESVQLNNSQLILGQTFASLPITFTGLNSQQSRPTRVGSTGPSAASPTFPSCVLIVLYDPCQAEVSNLAHQGRRHQDVGGSEVSVDIVPLLDEGHAFCNLHPKQRHPYPRIWPSPRWVSSKSRREMSKCGKAGKYVRQLPLFMWEGPGLRLAFLCLPSQTGGILRAWASLGLL